MGEKKKKEVKILMSINIFNFEIFTAHFVECIWLTELVLNRYFLWTNVKYNNIVTKMMKSSVNRRIGKH